MVFELHSNLRVRRVRFGLEVLFFRGLLLISSALGYLWKPDALPSAFWKVIKDTKLGKLDFIKRKVHYKRKADFTKESILWLFDPTPTILLLLLFIGT